MTITVAALIEKAKTLGTTAKIAWDSILKAEELVDEKGTALSGSAKKEYVLAVVADEIGDQIEVVGAALTDFIDSAVSFLNTFSWATKIIAALTAVLSLLTYAPALLGKAVGGIADLADAIFEATTGDELDQKTGDITQKETTES